MRIALFHGYELTGSGSNEYTRYLSRALAEQGHEVHVLCRESSPEAIEHVTKAMDWGAPHEPRVLFERQTSGSCTLHQLPHASVRPVYLTDKQRPGNVKAFETLTDAELEDYHESTLDAVRAVLARFPVDILHANHLVWQPVVAAETNVPFVIYPHGSAIEYTVRRDPRYHRAAARALRAASGLISGSQEVLSRILELYPSLAAELREKSAIVGVGVDTLAFSPIPLDERVDAIARVRPEPGGKTPAQTEELWARLARGEWSAVNDYASAYDHTRPDDDIRRKLTEIPWDAGRIVFYVGALTAGKGLQNLLCALPTVIERHPECHAVIVGSGKYREILEALVYAIAVGNDDLYQYLAARGFDLDASELSGRWEGIEGPVPELPHMRDHVHFLGRLGHENLRHVFPCADVSVFPSVVPEAYPLVLMESLASGVFPMASDFSGFADGFSELESWLGADDVEKMRLPCRDRDRVSGLGRRLIEALGEDSLPALRTELRTIAVDHYDWRIRAHEMTAAYERFAPSHH